MTPHTGCSATFFPGSETAWQGPSEDDAARPVLGSDLLLYHRGGCRMKVARRLLTAIVAVFFFGIYSGCVEDDRCGTYLGAQRLEDGSTVVCEACTNVHTAKVVRVSPDGSEIWSYRYPDSQLNGPHSAFWCLDDKMIIADTGHGRIILLDTMTKEILWDSRKITFSDPEITHNYANYACVLPNGNVLASIRDGHIVLELEFDGTIVWSFGHWAEPGKDDTHLNGPHWPERLENGNTLIPDSWNHRIIEVNPAGEIVWTYEPTGLPYWLAWPRCAQELPNGNVLITDISNYWEVTRQGEVVKQFCRPGTDDWGYMAAMLENGNYLLAGWHRIDEFTPQGELVWSYLSPWAITPTPVMIQ